MRVKAALKQIEPLLAKPCFTSAQARALGVSSATLAHYVSQGDLERLERGLYRGKDAPEVTDPRWEDLINAVTRAKEGVICLTSALAVYDLTEELPRQNWIAVRHETVYFHLPTTKVVRMRNLDLGKTTLVLGNVTLPIFDRERTLVDAFRYLGKESAVKALKAALRKMGEERLNLERLRRYAKELRVDIEPYLLAVTT